MGNEEVKPQSLKKAIDKIDLNNLSNQSFEYILKYLNRVYNIFYNEESKRSKKKVYAAYLLQEEKLNAEIEALRVMTMKNSLDDNWKTINKALLNESIPNNYIFNLCDTKGKGQIHSHNDNVFFDETKMNLRLLRLKNESEYNDLITMKMIKDIENIMEETKEVINKKLEELGDKFLLEKIYDIMASILNLKIEPHFHDIYLMVFKISNELIIKNDYLKDGFKSYNMKFLSIILTKSSKAMYNMVMNDVKRFDNWSIYSQLSQLLINIINALSIDEHLNLALEHLPSLKDIILISKKFASNNFWKGDFEVRTYLSVFFQKTMIFLHKLNREYPLGTKQKQIDQLQQTLSNFELESKKDFKKLYQNFKIKEIGKNDPVIFFRIFDKLYDNVIIKYKSDQDYLQLFWARFFLHESFDEIYKEINDYKLLDAKYLSIKEFINSLLLDYHNSQFFYYLTKDLSANILSFIDEANQLLEGLFYSLCLDAMFQHDYFNSEIHVKIVLIDIGLNSQLIEPIITSPIIILSDHGLTARKHGEIIASSYKFIVNFHLKAFDFLLLKNLSIFINDDKERIVLINRIYNLFDKTTDKHVKYYISLLFFVLSLNANIYTLLGEMNIIKPTAYFIQRFINNVYAKKKYKKQRKITSEIDLLFEILKVYSKESQFKRISHTNVYYDYLNIVFVLYYIDIPIYRDYICNILNHFLFFYPCKTKIMHESNKPILAKIQMEVYETIKCIVNPIKEYIGCYKEIQRIKKLLENTDIKPKYSMILKKEMKEFHSLSLSVHEKFFKEMNKLNQLSKRLRILLTICLVNDFDTRFDKVFYYSKDNIDLYTMIKDLSLIFGDGSEFKKVFAKNNKMSSIDEENELDSEDKQNKFEDKIKEYNNGIVHLALIRITKEPFSFPSYIKLEGYKCLSNNVFNQTLKESFDNDYDLFHKLIFAINKFIILIRVGDIGDQFNKLFTQCYQDKRFNFQEKGIETSQDLIYKCQDELFNLALNSSLPSSFCLILILFKYDTPSIINREILRLLCSLSMFNYNSILWCKFNSNKYDIDSSNLNELKVIYKSSNINNADIDFNYFYKKISFNRTLYDKGMYSPKMINDPQMIEMIKEEDLKLNRIISLPYKNIPSYNNNQSQGNGILINNNVAIAIPRLLRLPSQYTIAFKYYLPKELENNPTENIMKRTLLYTRDHVRMIFLNEQNLLCLTTIPDKVIELDFFQGKPIYDQWLEITISYDESQNNNTVYCSYTTSTNIIMKELKALKGQLPNCLALVGNDIHFKEPFGAVSDLCIINSCIPLLSNTDNKAVKSFLIKDYCHIKEIDDDNTLTAFENLLHDYTELKFCSQENMIYALKLFNHLLTVKELKYPNSLYPNISFLSSQFYTKLAFNILSSTSELKKEVSKLFKLID